MRKKLIAFVAVCLFLIYVGELNSGFSLRNLVNMAEPVDLA